MLGYFIPVLNIVKFPHNLILITGNMNEMMLKVLHCFFYLGIIKAVKVDLGDLF